MKRELNKPQPVCLKVIQGGLCGRPDIVMPIKRSSLSPGKLPPHKGWEMSASKINAIMAALWIHGDDKMRLILYGTLLQLNDQLPENKRARV